MIRKRHLAIKDTRTTVFLFLASAVVQMVLTMIRGKQLSFGETIGGAVALMLVPYLASLLLKWSFQLFAWIVGVLGFRIPLAQFSEGAFFVTFLMFWIALVIYNLLIP